MNKNDFFREIASEMIEKSSLTPFPISKKQALNATHLVFHMIGRRIKDREEESEGDWWEHTGWKIVRNWFSVQKTKQKKKK